MTVFKPDKNLILSADCNKTANINVKNLNILKQCLTATRPTEQSCIIHRHPDFDIAKVVVNLEL